VTFLADFRFRVPGLRPIRRFGFGEAAACVVKHSHHDLPCDALVKLLVREVLASVALEPEGLAVGVLSLPLGAGVSRQAA
jgi:hypothetical protein